MSEASRAHHISSQYWACLLRDLQPSELTCRLSASFNPDAPSCSAGCTTDGHLMKRPAMRMRVFSKPQLFFLRDNPSPTLRSTVRLLPGQLRLQDVSFSCCPQQNNPKYHSSCKSVVFPPRLRGIDVRSASNARKAAPDRTSKHLWRCSVWCTVTHAISA